MKEKLNKDHPLVKGANWFKLNLPDYDCIYSYFDVFDYYYKPIIEITSKHTEDKDIIGFWVCDNYILDDIEAKKEDIEGWSRLYETLQFTVDPFFTTNKDSILLSETSQKNLLEHNENENKKYKLGVYKIFSLCSIFNNHDDLYSTLCEETGPGCYIEYMIQQPSGNSHHDRISKLLIENGAEIGENVLIDIDY